MEPIASETMRELSRTVDAAQGRLEAFLAGKPDLRDDAARQLYLPIKAAFDAALERLGSASAGEKKSDPRE